MSKKRFHGVIQFIHPGGEHKVGSDGWTPWNLTMHKRKFMSATGSYVDKSDQVHESLIALWGEWEGPSKRLHSWTAKPPLPTNLVVPVYPGAAAPIDGLQNTDPYVFGNRFHYTLCKQSQRSGRTTFLAHLEPGSLILFGSRVQKKFVLDTVFVVDDNIIPHNRLTWNEQLSAEVSKTFRSVTLDPMYWDKNVSDEATHCLYSGARRDSPFHSMFSFFPCLPHTDGEYARFARPVIDIESVINHKLQQGQKGTELLPEQTKEVWLQVVEQVRNQGLHLGVSGVEPSISVVPDRVLPWKQKMSHSSRN